MFARAARSKQKEFPMTMVSPNASDFQANWKPKFFTIWAGQAVSLVGSALVQFALVWWLTVKTGSATTLATAILAALLPQIVLAPFAGALVDRWNRRRIMIVADAAIALVTGLLMVLFATQRVEIWHIYVVMFLRSLGGAFHAPAMISSTSLMVPKEHLTRVAGMNQTLQGSVTIVAPPLGALLLEWFSTQFVLAIDIGTALLAILPLLFIAIPQPERPAELQEGAKKASYWQEVRAGFNYVVAWPGLLGVILLAMMLNFLLSPTSALAPLVVTQIFEKGAAELGWVRALFGVGVILGGLLLSAWGGFKRRIATSLSGIILLGLAVILFGLVPSHLFFLLMVASFLQGFAAVFANGPLQAIFQSAIAPEMQGRVFSLVGAGSAAMMPLGLLIAGPVADWLGVQFWYLMGGAICVLITIGAMFVPAIMRIEENQAISAEAPLENPSQAIDSFSE
jgi:DHA3 family macrolide efflux protein-like MFS transporter